MSMLTLHPLSPKRFFKPALIGAGIGLAVMALFLSQNDGGKPEWGPYWMLRPLLVVTVATALGGAAFQFFRTLVKQPVWAKVSLTSFGLLIFVISLWLGSVLGLAGTYWN
ncbi:MAG TPA: hypothetical protein VIM89_04760 [Mucilaginibacter sp.]